MKIDKVQTLCPASSVLTFAELVSRLTMYKWKGGGAVSGGFWGLKSREFSATVPLSLGTDLELYLNGDSYYARIALSQAGWILYVLIPAVFLSFVFILHRADLHGKSSVWDIIWGGAIPMFGIRGLMRLFLWNTLARKHFPILQTAVRAITEKAKLGQMKEGLTQ
jgi:hypothetical protein